jgi:hypothetical protein
VPGKLGDVGDDDRRPVRRRRPADPSPELDVEAAQRSLVRADAEQPPGLDHPVESCPEVPERMMNEGADRRHSGDRVVDAGEHALDLRLERGVGSVLRQVAKVEGDFGHW